MKRNLIEKGEKPLQNQEISKKALQNKMFLGQITKNLLFLNTFFKKTWKTIGFAVTGPRPRTLFSKTNGKPVVLQWQDAGAEQEQQQEHLHVPIYSEYYRENYRE